MGQALRQEKYLESINYLDTLLGAVIGLDREYRAKEAGYRTHFLVSLGSALIMIVSQYGFMEIQGVINLYQALGGGRE